MSADPNRYKLTAAKELMQSDQYDAARAVLETIPFDPTARQWLTWMDENVPSKRKAKPRGGWGLWRVIAFVLVCSFCSFIGGFGAAMTPTARSAQATTVGGNSTTIPTWTPVPRTDAPRSTDEPTDEPTNTIAPTVESTTAPLEPITFDSSTEGLQAVIGPVDIPSGVYKVTATTAGFIAVTVETVSGTCSTNDLGDSLFNLVGGGATDGAETLFGSDDCRVLLQVSNTTEPWMLEFGALVPVPAGTLSFSSQQYSLQAVIGPVTIPSGTYRATATTAGFISVQLGSVTGTCDVGFGESLFNLMQGQAADGAEAVLHSTDCVALIIVSNTQDEWTLDFEALN